MIKLLFDTKLMRPGCILLQAAAGCMEHKEAFHRLFRVEDWLVAPTADMKIMHGTEEQWQKVSKALQVRNANPPHHPRRSARTVGHRRPDGG